VAHQYCVDVGAGNEVGRGCDARRRIQGSFLAKELETRWRSIGSGHDFDTWLRQNCRQVMVQADVAATDHTHT
jgi:hypothetical protein